MSVFLDSRPTTTFGPILELFMTPLVKNYSDFKILKEN